MVLLLFLQSALEKLEIEIETNMKLTHEDKQTVRRNFYQLLFCFSIKIFYQFFFAWLHAYDLLLSYLAGGRQGIRRS